MSRPAQIEPWAAHRARLRAIAVEYGDSRLIVWDDATRAAHDAAVQASLDTYHAALVEPAKILGAARAASGAQYGAVCSAWFAIEVECRANE